MSQTVKKDTKLSASEVMRFRKFITSDLLIAKHVSAVSRNVLLPDPVHRITDDPAAACHERCRTICHQRAETGLRPRHVRHYNLHWLDHLDVTDHIKYWLCVNVVYMESARHHSRPTCLTPIRQSRR